MSKTDAQSHISQRKKLLEDSSEDENMKKVFVHIAMIVYLNQSGSSTNPNFHEIEPKSFNASLMKTSRMTCRG